MKLPRMRIGTLMLLIAVAGLAVALVMQQRRLGDAERRLADLEARDPARLYRLLVPQVVVPDATADGR